MLKKYFYSLCVFSILLCSNGDSHCSSISGAISFNDNTLADSVGITIDSYYYADHVIHLKQSEPNFSFDLESGKYQLSITSAHTTPYRTNVLIDNQNKNLQFDIKLGQSSSAVVKGFKYHDDYNSLLNDINIFHKNLFALNMGKATLNDFKVHNNNMKNELLKIEQKYPHYFSQVFVETRLSHLANFHPMTYFFREYGSDGKIDSLDIEKIYSSSIFPDFFQTTMALLKKLDPGSMLLNGNFFMGLGRLEAFESCLLKDNKIEKNYFYNFITDFVEKATDKYCAANLLFRKAESYSVSQETGKAMYLLSWLKEDHPNFRVVTNGELDNLLTRMQLKESTSAPDFSIKTVSGDSIKLSDLKGKFVFLDFWGTWCSACTKEIKNIKKLQDSFSTEELLVIGLANDKIDKVRDYIKKEKITYPNAVVGQEILNKYGITGYPTTFLITPDGKIIKKYLRGNKLAAIIKNEIKTYQKN